MANSLPSRVGRLAAAWQRLRVEGRDAVGAAGLLAVSLAPLGVPGVELGDLRGAVPRIAALALTVGQTAPLALRRRAPGLALVVVGLCFAVAQLTGAGTGLAGLGLFVALYSSAAYQPHNRRLALGLTAAAYVALAAALHTEGSPERPVDWVTFGLVLTTPWFVGLLVRRRLADQADRERRAADSAVRASRDGLARDLHDIVTHHVTAIVVQADSAAYLDPSDVAERAATLETIAATGRRALHELRSLLGALEQTETAPREPLAHDVPALVEECAAAGLPVTLVGSPLGTAVSEPVAITLYRIAQESITNATRHAPTEPITIFLDETGRRVRLTVTNPMPVRGGAQNGQAAEGDVLGTALPAGSSLPAGLGFGRRSMAARIALLGGSFRAGEVSGRFEVVAELAVDAEARS